MNPGTLLLLVVGSAAASELPAQDLYLLPSGAQPRWFSFENRDGRKGGGAESNRGAKGNAWEPLRAGEQKTLMEYRGCGTIRRIWFTFRPFTQEMLRSVVLEMTWDGAKKPAVSVPLGDFFAQGLAVPFAGENALFSNPEGRSLNCYVPMPFRTSAKIVVRNEAKTDVGLLFYEIDMTAERAQPANAGYFHAFWSRVPKTKLGEDYTILPKVKGRGRYLGATLGVQGDQVYGDAGWGEGEVKVYLDGDMNLPTLAGTGTEDYIGTGWGMGPFTHRYQGCTVSDATNHCWAFYRFHIPDPITFDKECRVTIQDIGGESTAFVRKLAAAGAPLIPVSAAAEKGLGRLRSDPSYPKLESPLFPLDAWVNFYRSDDYSSVAYFYLDRPTTGLPSLPPVEQRTVGLRPIKQ